MLCRALPIISTIRAGVVGMLALAAAALPAVAWERPHGNGANLNFENVATAPAGSLGITKVSDIGTIASGAGPVIAPDGTVYIGNREGEGRDARRTLLLQEEVQGVRADRLREQLGDGHIGT